MGVVSNDVNVVGVVDMVTNIRNYLYIQQIINFVYPFTQSLLYFIYVFFSFLFISFSFVIVRCVFDVNLIYEGLTLSSALY